MLWSPTNTAHISPMPIASWIITLNFSCCFSQRIFRIKRVNYLAVFTDHSQNPPNDSIANNNLINNVDSTNFPTSKLKSSRKVEIPIDCIIVFGDSNAILYSAVQSN